MLTNAHLFDHAPMGSRIQIVLRSGGRSSRHAAEHVYSFTGIDEFFLENRVCITASAGQHSADRA